MDLFHDVIKDDNKQKTNSSYFHDPTRFLGETCIGKANGSFLGETCIGKANGSFLGETSIGRANGINLKPLIPGFVQGVVSITISYPTHVLKVNMQKNNLGIIPAFRHIVQNGYTSFYKGASLMYGFSPLTKSFEFLFLESTNKYFKSEDSKSGSLGASFKSGILLGSVSAFYSVPLHFLTTNMAINKTKTIMQLIKENNIYKGFIVEYSRTFLGTCINIGTYMTLRENIKNKNLTIAYAPLMGSFAHILASTCTFPLDVIRTEKQTSNLSFKEIIINKKKLGFSSFYKGWTPTMIRVLPSSSLSMLAYETTRKYFDLSK